MNTPDQALIARKLTHLLDKELTDLPPDVLTRLHAGRRTALTRHRVRVPLWSGAGLARQLSATWFRHRRSLVAVSVVLAVFAIVDLAREADGPQDLDEIDSALLADDLPIDAYLDRGFDRWLKHDAGDSSHS